MFYTVPTKRGLGVEIWGTYDDLNVLYDVIGKFWNDSEKQQIKGFDNRDALVSSFAYEIRHAYQGSRLTRGESHFSNEKCNYLGTRISWVHFLFTLSALRLNMSYTQPDKFDLSIFLQLEHWLEKSMTSFDKATSNRLIPFIEGAIYSGNEFLYQFMRQINAEYFSLGGGKSNFRKLPILMQKSVYFSEEYKSYMSQLEKDAKRLNCKISDLDINDDNIPYDVIEW